jgi:cytosine/adenosine deaminase-related metal-dependent hydrolase
MLDARTLVVHAVQLTDADLGRLREIGATIVTCPRSNQWVGVGVPPIARFYDAGVPVAIGTDSLASVDDLNLFSELQALHWLAPQMAPARLLESATRAGAEALGLGDQLGTIEAGKRAELIAVSLDGGLTASPGSISSSADAIERYLVSGIDPRQVRWLGE